MRHQSARVIYMSIRFGVRHKALLLAVTLSLSSATDALNILITNDDGFEASTIHALYQTLKAGGHNVIISSETQDNSGRGGGADFLQPIGPLKQDSRAGFVKAGAPGVGTLPADGDVHYVDGAPVAAALYGIDIAAPRKWRAVPDLVISGPNYGNNTGLINNSSGTVNAALICINRGVPAIAISTANPATYKSFDKLAPGDPEYEVANIVSNIVAVLEAQQRKYKTPLLPAGLGLNVNIPQFAAGSSKHLAFKVSREGTAASVTPIFVEDLSQDAGAHALGLSLPTLPGISVALPNMPPTSRAWVVDTDPASEQNVIHSGAISISVIKGNHQADGSSVAAVRRTLKTLLLNGTIDKN
jgi:5'-nucleotidase